MPPTLLRRAWIIEQDRDKADMEIYTIYVSGDESRPRKLNASRQTAGEKTISALIDSIDGDALRERGETSRQGMK
ncbi:hypothetical protein CFIMG_003913RAa [Ceratocystis fimbriata CBS 114723]|uniref:Uncharacterized protein n=1 Tax=Ceratocystis fimbriata CBS 114723 TaxID=1035309 RepID=A0A2C5WVR8_9PEZI|nr:hypothetical protein CFIMG_003913RAa [Ceratocystis fimbriata CBS 114723]